MGLARLGSFAFRLDPESVRWPFRIKASVKRTVGGKVVQVFGSEFGDMTVTGAFGVGGWREQQTMLTAMQTIGDNQADGAEPMRFLYPPKKWDFLVYLRSFDQVGGANTVEWVAGEFSIRWSLTLFIAEDNSGIKKVVQDDYIDRLAAGIGWKQTKFNGPMAYGEIDTIVSELGFADLAAYTGSFSAGKS